MIIVNHMCTIYPFETDMGGIGGYIVVEMIAPDINQHHDNLTDFLKNLPTDISRHG